jgi:hypothetical protein
MCTRGGRRIHVFTHYLKIWLSSRDIHGQGFAIHKRGCHRFVERDVNQAPANECTLSIGQRPC